MKGWWQSPSEAGRSWIFEEELGKGLLVDRRKVGYGEDEVVE
jgi:hypothetical protein